MTTERAIELLNRISDSQFDGIHGDERREALEMAVRALEQNLVKESGDLVQDLVNDCISRKQAIDALDKHIDTFDAIDTNYLCGLRTAMSILKEMPSAQPERLTDDDFERLTDDDFEAIRIHLNSYKEKLCNQHRWKEAEEYQRIIDRFIAFASAQPQRKKGRWIWWYEEEFTEHATEYTPHCKCSECGRECAPSVATYSNFCCNCGADMRTEDDNV